MLVKGDFFDKYSKDEFLIVLWLVTDAKFDIPKEIKFNKKGITTEWKNSWDFEELKAKDYFVSYKRERS